MLRFSKPQVRQAHLDHVVDRGHDKNLQYPILVKLISRERQRAMARPRNDASNCSGEHWAEHVVGALVLFVTTEAGHAAKRFMNAVRDVPPIDDGLENSGCNSWGLLASKGEDHL
eukprot:NODE_27047_length_527_cov_5.012500.p1 GENE.NODE_27047_length_527_cov_5.012500~~NODE_27047_length_527_cov_5.012500.p1  ORF type:complete len:115 (-),score=5.50 NODE_27047_length_527_cov_5.012500:32-376(-)